MADVLYRVLNPVVKRVLRSPLHPLLSRNTLLLRYTGRISGRRYELPISYARRGDRLHGFTTRQGRWWRNLRDGADVQLLVAGRLHIAKASVESENEQRIASEFCDFLAAVPRDARLAGVRLDRDGVPDADDIVRAAARLVSLHFALADEVEPKENG